MGLYPPDKAASQPPTDKSRENNTYMSGFVLIVWWLICKLVGNLLHMSEPCFVVSTLLKLQGFNFNLTTDFEST